MQSKRSAAFRTAADQLHQRREQLRVTKYAAAKAAGISQGLITRIEQGDGSSFSTVENLIEALGGEWELVIKWKDDTTSIPALNATAASPRKSQDPYPEGR